jgi:hypothetical protein
MRLNMHLDLLVPVHILAEETLKWNYLCLISEREIAV